MKEKANNQVLFEQVRALRWTCARSRRCVCSIDGGVAQALERAARAERDSRARRRFV
jgi:pentose-5-phosphate-3-epimerase